MLNKCLLPFASEQCPRDWIYQQDNAPSHVSNAMKQFLSESTVDVLPWPAKSPDQNIIENLCGILVYDVYKNAKQYFLVDQNRRFNYSNLYNSTHKRCTDVIERDGRKLSTRSIPQTPLH